MADPAPVPSSSVTGEILGDLSSRKRRPEPCTIVIFGALGDLSGRKLAPAIYNLTVDGTLTEPTQVIGVSRGNQTREQFIELFWPDSPARKAIGNFHVAMHCLRKTLESRLAAGKDSSFIHRRTNNFYAFDSGAGCHVVKCDRVRGWRRKEPASQTEYRDA